MEAIKLWIINVGIKKLGPSFIRAALAWVIALVAAHQGILATFGIIYDKAANTLTLHLGTLEGWLLGAGLGVITAALAAAQHHTEAVITKKPEVQEQAMEVKPQ